MNELIFSIDHLLILSSHPRHKMTAIELLKQTEMLS